MDRTHCNRAHDSQLRGWREEFLSSQVGSGTAAAGPEAGGEGEGAGLTPAATCPRCQGQPQLQTHLLFYSVAWQYFLGYTSQLLLLKTIVFLIYP